MNVYVWIPLGIDLDTKILVPIVHLELIPGNVGMRVGSEMGKESKTAAMSMRFFLLGNSEGKPINL